ncbi:DegT/DnrJ/EryC1/StrS family aminotransferase [Hoeflea sp. TYP-13]|uniref:DegT/DnrJ/EryC1/StrS family aminotransferase n=1 Tax=Hoeflea sp. TYP-13 TaxID=3230023 RepID=UPI0034C6C009
MRQPIQLFTPNFRVEECLDGIRECLEKGWTGLGYKTNEIEDAWLDYTRLPNAHFLNSNTAGLHLALHMFKTEFDWEDGDEVISTPMTFVSTNHAIIQCNMTPVFADIDDYLCIDPDDLEQKLTPRTRAVFFVGIGGNTGNYLRVAEICRERGIILILDAAHMAGTRLNGRHVGFDADCTIFSFQAVKNMATADSGMICFSDKTRDERARKLTWLGINRDTYSRTLGGGAYKWMYDVEELGFKYHGNSIMAAIALVSLRHLDRDNAYRRQLAKWYEERLLKEDKIQIVPTFSGCESSRHLFQVRLDKRDQVLMALNEYEIYPGVHYRDNTEYAPFVQNANTCPNARQASLEILSLPMHMGVTERDVDYITEKLSEIVRKEI